MKVTKLLIVKNKPINVFNEELNQQKNVSKTIRLCLNMALILKKNWHDNKIKFTFSLG